MRPPTVVEIQVPWWCTPAGLVLGFVMPVVFIVAAAGAADLPSLTIRGFRFLTPQSIALAAGLLLVAAIGGWLGAQLEIGQRDPADEAGWEDAACIVGCIALAAYLFWFRDIFFNPGLLWATLTGANVVDRSEMSLTTGITSLANISPVFFAVYAYFVLGADRRALKTRTHILAAALLLLTVFRVYAWSERLAMMEVAVPFGLAAGGLLIRRKGALSQVARIGGPYVALPLVILFFGAAEYFRSWTADAYHGKSGFWEFAIGRFASYYYTSLNNGAGLITMIEQPTWTFEIVLAWMHTMPLPVGKIFGEVVNGPRWAFGEYLLLYGDVEFNSPTAIFAAVHELGLAGAVLYLFVVGVASGLCFRAYERRMALGVLMYPMFLLNILEILRYPYVGQGRAFTWFVGVVLLIAFAKWASWRRRSYGVSP
jgi:hypothetical protein